MFRHLTGSVGREGHTLLSFDNLSSVNHTTSNAFFATADVLVIGIYTIGIEVHDDVSDGLYGVVELKEAVEVASIANIFEANRLRGCCTHSLYVGIWIVQLHQQECA